MSIDVLYILGKGSVWQDNELRFSLRSLEHFVSGVRNVVLVGEKPEWINPETVRYIPSFPAYTNKARNIAEHVLKACKDTGLTDELLFLNDDYFFTGAFHAPTYPHFFKCDLYLSLRINSKDYKEHLKVTIKELEKRGLPLLNYDHHFPFRINREKMREVIESARWDKLTHGYILKSLYGNSVGLEAEQRKDMKVFQEQGKKWWTEYFLQTEVFSVADSALNEHLKSLLCSLFPEPCKWEV